MIDLIKSKICSVYLLFQTKHRAKEGQQRQTFKYGKFSEKNVRWEQCGQIGQFI